MLGLTEERHRFPLLINDPPEIQGALGHCHKDDLEVIEKENIESG